MHLKIKNFMKNNRYHNFKYHLSFLVVWVKIWVNFRLILKKIFKMTSF
jgi:uncharacterized membrane protein